MRVLYLDLGMGAAGDMLSAALFELLSRKEQEDYLSAMNHLGLDGVSVQAERSEKCGKSLWMAARRRMCLIMLIHMSTRTTTMPWLRFTR